MTLKKLLLACVIFTSFAGMAYAQLPAADRYGSAFELDEDGVPFSSRYYKGTPNTNVISLIRKPELTEDQVVLRITDPHIKSGCVDISDYGYQAEYKDIYLDIVMGELTIDLRDQPQYSHYQCDINSQIPTADIVINKSDLIQNQTQKIRLHNGPDTNYYVVTYTDDMIKILPDPTDAMYGRRFKPHNLPHKKTALVHWFYPVGTIIMWVPGLENAVDGVEKLRGFAKARGLVPLETVIPEFQSPSSRKGMQYFVDTGGRIVNEDTDLQYGKTIGSITVEKTVYGLEKNETELDQMPVYARVPGMYD